MSKSHPAQREWYAISDMKKCGSNESIGNLCFKGICSGGSVEIGYGVNEGEEGNGYATEAVTALVNWAARQWGST